LGKREATMTEFTTPFLRDLPPTLGLNLQILRTIRAVFGHRGAY
jgi:hypothetical protein